MSMVMSHVPYFTRRCLLIFNLIVRFRDRSRDFRVVPLCAAWSPHPGGEKGTLPALTLRRYHKVTTSHVCPPPLLYESQSVC